MSLKKLSVVLGVLADRQHGPDCLPGARAAGRREGRDAGRRAEGRGRPDPGRREGPGREAGREESWSPRPRPRCPKRRSCASTSTTYPDIIDPQKSSFVNEIAHLKLIYEGLTKLDKDLKTVPGAAEKWEYNDDATELTFTLQHGPEVQRRHAC